MGDRFRPISMEQLTDWVFDELETKESIFGIPRSAFFVPDPADRFRVEVYGRTLETPLGVAAGPHTQMAQNIIVAWLMGARFIELKTIQTLDELQIAKPCIEVEDEGYNIEWSQELKVYESFDEYLRAWVLVHALHARLGFPGDAPGVIFNMSVGYDLAGIQRPNVQWYLDTMRDASAYLDHYVDIVGCRFPKVHELDIPTCISDTMTLSTMHGCPPEEIEAITLYLLRERGLHTSVKCNPTLLGAERVRKIVNEDLGFIDVPVPDEAFGHDLKYVDAVPMFHNLRRVAAAEGSQFGLKLSNTLEVENWRSTFDAGGMMYLSGRALHPLTANLAAMLSEEFRGSLMLSYAGGADCFNAADLLAAGMTTVTVCSDLLKTGGYLRLAQYTENLATAMQKEGAADLADFSARRAVALDGFAEFAPLLRWSALTDSGLALDEEACAALQTALVEGQGPPLETVRAWAASRGLEEGSLVALVSRVSARLNLRRYAAAVRSDWRYQKASFRMDHSKTSRELGSFDCIEAPCVDECPVDQNVPRYMAAVREGDFAEAVRLTRVDNPLPSILGHVCDHLCESTCIRTHLDQPLAIRHMKRFIMEQEGQPLIPLQRPGRGARVAIIGAGPAGLSAAQWLGRSGYSVTIFESHRYPGGMVGGAIPEYRLPQASIDQDLAVLRGLGVEIRYGRTAGIDFTLDDLRGDGFEAIFVAIGAQLAKRLGLPGEDAEGVIDALHFLRSVREGRPLSVGPRVAVIGAGDTAMDAVRSARRVGATTVSLVYRRTIDQMPADREEVEACREEGVGIIELARPTALHVEDGRLVGLVCTRTAYGDEREASGRKVPIDVPGSEFEIELDTLILAISQHSVLDLFGDEMPALTRSGYIDVDPFTFETSIPRVYAGGDVALDGPSSIVRAAADGKAVARAIVAALDGEAGEEPAIASEQVDLPLMIQRRARREYRVPIEHTPLEARGGFEPTVLGYSVEQAQAEASRCLDCDLVCSLCVGVCPNMALLTYGSEPFSTALPQLHLEEDRVVTDELVAYRAAQRLQIAVLTDFCNECGNCVTVCPTSGRPYLDKPRLYLDSAEFEAQSANAFMLLDDGSIAGRYDGETHRLSLDGVARYESPALSASLEPGTLALIEAWPGSGARRPTLRPAADMYVLHRGLSNTMSHLPRAAGAIAAGSRIPHPGYPE